MPRPSIVNRRLLIEHRYSLVADHRTIVEHLIEYWTSRGFALSIDGSGNLVGTRGSYLANFTSFDSTKLISSIVLECSEQGQVKATTLIDLSGQMLTAWNQLDLELEQVLCHRGFIGLPDPSLLRKYKKTQVLSNIMWVLTLGLTTHVMPTQFRTLLEDVNPSAEFPKLRYLSPGDV